MVDESGASAAAIGGRAEEFVADHPLATPTGVTWRVVEERYGRVADAT